MNLVEDYVESHRLQKAHAIALLEEFSDEMKEIHGKCMDIGCGPGTITREILMPSLPNSSQFVGGDISGGMIEYAKKFHSDEKRLSFIEFNAERDELPSDQINQYDFIFSSFCLHFCQNLRKAFENIYELLRPGGKVLTMFLRDHALYSSYLDLYDNPKYKPYMQDVQKFMPYLRYFQNSRATLKKMLKDIGFDVIHCSSRDMTYTYENSQDLHKHMLAVNPFSKRMPKNVRLEFEEDFLLELKRKVPFFENEDNISEKQKILDRCYVMITYLKKPSN